MINEEITLQPYEYLKDGFLKPKQVVYRYNGSGTRYYYTLEGGFKVHASGTTLVKDGYAKDDFSLQALESWRNALVAKGINPAEELSRRADYGTILHILYGDFVRGEKIPIRGLHNYIKRMHTPHMTKVNKEYIMKYKLNELRHDLLAFNKWYIDHNVEALAVELMIASHEDNAATAIDLICDLDVEVKGFHGEVYKSGAKKGEPKETKQIQRVRAIVDFKSGRKGFYKSHELQLLLNRRWMNEIYPEIKIDRMFNFSPKDWRTAPDYNFKDQTESDAQYDNGSGVILLDTVIQQGKWKHHKKTKDVKRFQGTIQLTESFNFEDNFQKMELEEYVTKFKDEVRDVAGEIVEDEDLRGATEVKRFFTKWLAKDLKQLAEQTGMPYKTKPEFIKNLAEKYKNFLTD